MPESEDKYAYISVLSKIAFAIGCLCLYGIAIWIFGAAIYDIFNEVISDNFTIYKLLDEVGLIVFSIAVIDVSKFLMIEEVLKGPNRTQKEERHTFSRFIIIILTALSLEGLVLTIETAKTDLSMIIYPILLFVVVTIMIIGLAIFQKLNADSERGS